MTQEFCIYITSMQLNHSLKLTQYSELSIVHFLFHKSSHLIIYLNIVFRNSTDILLLIHFLCHVIIYLVIISSHGHYTLRPVAPSSCNFYTTSRKPANQCIWSPMIWGITMGNTIFISYTWCLNDNLGWLFQKVNHQIICHL